MGSVPRCCAILGGVLVSVALAANTASAAPRSYELVSPPAKNGISVDPGKTVQASADGDAVGYSAPGAFAGAVTSVTGGYYVGKRAATGWSVDPIDPPQVNTDGQLAMPSLFLAPDLSKAVQFSARALTAGAVERGGNIYLRDNQTGLRTLLVGTADTLLTQNLVTAAARALLGSSGDLSHFAFSSQAVLLPDVPDGSIRKAYELVDGTVRLVSILPDGTIDPGGGSIGSDATNTPASRPVSADGERIVFQSPAGTGGLYMRIGGETTVPISLSQRAGGPTVPSPATFAGASEDGSLVYFTSDVPLTDDDSAGLYRYDVDAGSLELLTPLRGDPLDFSVYISKVLAVSADGSTAYFISTNNLAGNATAQVPNLYAVRDGELSFIGPLDPNEYVINGVASPNGRYFAFASYGRPTGFDNASVNCKTVAVLGSPDGTCVETYRYDAVTKQVSCLSCLADADAGRNSDIGLQPATISDYVSRAVLDDGRVFFTTAEALTAADINGKRDVYEWNNGVTTLISSGRSTEDSSFAEASADGRDVFFFTSERLLPIDVDDETDLYDARQGGGIPAQQYAPPPSPSCEQDGCQGGVATPAVLSTVASVNFAGGSDQPGAGPSRPPVARVSVSTPRAVRGNAAAVRVKVPAKGRLTVTGERIRDTRRALSRAGSYSVTVSLTRGARALLKRHKTLKVSVRVGFVPSQGRVSSASVRLTFKTKVTR